MVNFTSVLTTRLLLDIRRYDNTRFRNLVTRLA